jgi:outer membrane protein assembly factor BamB
VELLKVILPQAMDTSEYARDFMEEFSNGKTFYKQERVLVEYAELSKGNLPEAIIVDDDTEVEDSVELPKEVVETLESKIITTGIDNKVYGLDLAGNKRWDFELDGFGVSAMSEYKDFICILTDASEENKFYVLDAENGEKKWEFSLSAKTGPHEVILNKNHNLIYFKSPDKAKIKAFDIEAGEETWEFEFSNGWENSDVYVIGDNLIIRNNAIESKLCVKDAKTSEDKFEHTHEKEVNYIVADDKALYFSSWDYKVHALDINTGEKLWDFDIEHIIRAPLVLDDDYLYFGSSNNFYAIDVNTGVEKWRYNAREYISAPIVIQGNTIYFNSGSELLAIDKTTGEKEWSADDSDGLKKVLGYKDIAIIEFTDGSLIGVDQDVKWQYELGALGVSKPKLYEDFIYFFKDNKLHVLNAEDGNELICRSINYD